MFGEALFTMGFVSMQNLPWVLEISGECCKDVFGCRRWSPLILTSSLMCPPWICCWCLALRHINSWDSIPPGPPETPSPGAPGYPPYMLGNKEKLGGGLGIDPRFSSSCSLTLTPRGFLSKVGIKGGIRSGGGRKEGKQETGKWWNGSNSKDRLDNNEAEA